MREQSIFTKILIVIGIFFAGILLLNLLFSLLGSVLWISVKILFPVAAVTWILRQIITPFRNKRRYY